MSQNLIDASVPLGELGLASIDDVAPAVLSREAQRLGVVTPEVWRFLSASRSGLQGSFPIVPPVLLDEVAEFSSLFSAKTLWDKFLTASGLGSLLGFLESLLGGELAALGVAVADYLLERGGSTEAIGAAAESLLSSAASAVKKKLESSKLGAAAAAKLAQFSIPAWLAALLAGYLALILWNCAKWLWDVLWS